MHLTPELEAELRLVLDTYWSSYLEGDLDTWASYLAEEYHNIGTTKEEVWHSKQEIMDYTLSVIQQLQGGAQVRNKVFEFVDLSPYIMVHELGNLYLHVNGEWVFYSPIRMTSLMDKRADGWKILHQHASYPDANAGQGDVLGFEKISKENHELREAVQRRTIDLEVKNRELEIEAALEKVRSVALSMQSPEDMLQICTVIAHQLDSLGLKDLRNVQTAIFHPERGTYMNYEFYAKHNKTFITDVDYQNHPIQLSFAQKMMKGPNEEVHEQLMGQALIDWFNFQKTTNQFADEYLLTADSLNYYWYSLGPVALGTSTYTPLSVENLGLFKRFMNVFGLAYQRYLDIEKAMQQAREAQIEAAMEKVRGRSLAMEGPDEIREVAELLRSEMAALGVEELETSSIYISEPGTSLIECWYAIKDVRGTASQLVSDEMTLDLRDTWVGQEMQKFLLSVDVQVSIPMKGDQRKEWINYCADRSEKLKGYYGTEIPERTYHLVKFANGFMGAASPGDISAESWKLLKRAAAVFSFAYTRFLDLREAAENAREAQIELGLERVRAKTMAMYKSSQLPETAQVLFEQFAELGRIPDRMSIGIVKEESGIIEWWVTDQTGSQLTTHFDASIDQMSVSKLFAGWKQGMASLVLEITGEELKAWVSFVRDVVRMPIDESKIKGKRVHHAAYFSQGILLISAHEPVSEETMRILVRFARVFEQAYTRFLDLQKAEAQAREAQVEAALERVRSRSMAMHKSEELSNLSTELVKQVQALGVKTWFCAFNIYDDDPRGSVEWGSNGEGAFDKYRTPKENVFLRYYEAGHRGEVLLVNEIGKDICPAHYEYLCTLPGLGQQLLSMKAAGVPFPESQIDHVAYFKYGYLLFISYEPVPESHDIFIRFARVFEQTYTRFLDLQKAEAQAREAQVEAALERVRARAMAMHSSEDLAEVVGELRKQMGLLGQKDLETCVIHLHDESPDFIHSYAAIKPPGTEGEILETTARVPKSGLKIIEEALEAYAQHRHDYIIVNEGEKLRQWFAFLEKESPQGFNKLVDPVHGKLEELRGYWSLADFAGGSLVMVTMEPPSDHTRALLRRFSNVFGLAYRRYADLKKAEAQAREGQIQLALERVRARAMAMQKSSELAEAAVELFQQVRSLGIVSYTSGFTIWEKDNTELVSWTSNADGSINPPFHMPAMEYDWHREQFRSWQAREDYVVRDFSGEDLKQHYAYLRSFPLLDEAFRKSEASGVQTPDRQVHNVFNFAHGNLLFITQRPVTESFPIFKRFARTFEQCYTRFLDLQKAEAQARESQVEAALERVRAKAMAMHSSSDLPATAIIAFTELKKLGFIPIRSGISIQSRESRKNLLYSATNAGDGETLSIVGWAILDNHPVLREVYDNWLVGKDSFPELHGEQLRLYYEQVRSSFEVPIEQTVIDQHGYFICFTHGLFYGWCRQPVTEEEKALLRRFASVIDLTFKRYFDLQKAEAQAREAQIETALERVRSRGLGMQKSEELKDVIQVVYEQLIHLNIRTEHAGFIMDYKYRDDFQTWIADHLGSPSYVTIPYFDCIYYNRFNEAKSAGTDFFTLTLNKQEKDTFYQGLFRLLPGFPEKSKQIIFGHPGFSISTVLMEDVALYIENFTGDPYDDESNAILMRFGKVFQQTYTRFLDLQKAEAQAREAKVEAALEKVRSRTLAMQRSDELAETAAVMFRQLITLGISPNRLYIILFREHSPEMEAWVTDEDGSRVSIGFTGNLNRSRTLYKMHEGWVAQRKSLILDMQGEELQEYLRYLHDELQVPFKGGMEQKRRVQHVAYFSKGLIGMASPEPQPEETLQLLERFAAVFNLTFTRFNDLKVAEAHARKAEEDLIAIKEAKQKAEETLKELQATQKQLIQSEKMASLGELTAGIAHEIQNPLNFVNNFSEVSKELLDEVRESLTNGDLDGAMEVMRDLVLNLERINEHGKRADSIVKGMLQHSRASSGQKEPTDINAMADECLRLAFHGLRAKDKSFNAGFELHTDPEIGKVEVMAQDMGRVLLNLINNAFYAVNERSRRGEAGFKPMVKVFTAKGVKGVMIKVEDNGDGIPATIRDKIFQPFFTTKPTGLGTGLGLSLAYDIVKAHGGELTMESKEGDGTVFVIWLPNQ